MSNILHKMRAAQLKTYTPEERVQIATVSIIAYDYASALLLLQGYENEFDEKLKNALHGMIVNVLIQNEPSTSTLRAEMQEVNAKSELFKYNENFTDIELTRLDKSVLKALDVWSETLNIKDLKMIGHALDD